MKEVPGGGNKRNVLHFQWLLKVQRKKAFLLWDPCQSCKGNLQSCQYHAIWHHSILPSGRGKEVTKRCFSFKAASQYILVPEQKERYGQNSSAKKGREGWGTIWSFSAHTCQPFPAHLLGWFCWSYWSCRPTWNSFPGKYCFLQIAEQRTDLASYEAIDELKHKAHTHVVQTRLKIRYQSTLAMLMTMLLLISMSMLMSGWL